jgi:aminoglycoside 2''-phosphotransferase
MKFLRNFAATLLPDAAMHAAKSAKLHFQARAILPSYTDRIRQTFPDLSFRDARIILSGFANVVVILDETWVFRFPRNESRRAAFERELTLLAELRPNAPIDVPDYNHVAPGHEFGGYPMIRGEWLNAALFASLDRPAQERALIRFVQFLGALHALPTGLVAAGDSPRQAENSFAASEWYFSEKRDYLVKKIDRDLVRSMDRFYLAFSQARPFEERLINSDIGEDHLLYDRDSDRLGMIDFGDATVGDPALDFALLCTYPDWAAPFAFRHYPLRAEDPELLTRAKWHAIRQLGDRLWFHFMRKGHHHPLEETVASLRTQLALLGI